MAASPQFESLQDEIHKIHTIDENGAEVDIQFVIKKEGEAFVIVGLDIVGGHPISFINYYGDSYKDCVILGLSASGGTIAILHGNKGYVQFHKLGDTFDFTGQQVSYSN